MSEQNLERGHVQGLLEIENTRRSKSGAIFLGLALSEDPSKACVLIRKCPMSASCPIAVAYRFGVGG